jgi:predicted glycoside hydrolase/deacetylase ChbG (UPF0249 family)
VRRFVRGRVRLSEVYDEWRAQLSCAVALGVRPAHLDSHQHLHLLPGLFSIALRLCREFDIPRIRVPRAGWPGRPVQALASTCLELFSRYAMRTLSRMPGRRPLFCQRFLGREHSCALSLPALLSLIKSIRGDANEATYELMCHPGLPDEKALRRHPFGVNWAVELAALTSQDAKSLIEGSGIVLVGALGE